MPECEIQSYIHQAQSNHDLITAPLFKDVGESLERVVEASHDRYSCPDLVPQGEDVHGSSNQHPAEYHPEGEAGHVPGGVALVVGDVRPVRVGVSLPVSQHDHLQAGGGDVLATAAAVFRNLEISLTTLLSLSVSILTYTYSEGPGSDGLLQHPLALGQVPHGLYR